MNRDKARELLEKELRIRPTVKASAIFTGKTGAWASGPAASTPSPS